MTYPIQPVLHQLNVAVRSVAAMLEHLEESDLDDRPAENQRPLREMFSHLAVLCRADWHILNGASEAEMEALYARHRPRTREEIRRELLESYQYLADRAFSLDEARWEETVRSWWGAEYTRFGWLVQIVAHFCHHRGQLHARLTLGGKRPEVPLFE